VLDPGTRVIGAGQPARSGIETAGERLGDAFACHDFRIKQPEQKKECSEGFVLDAAGRCVCPEGTTFRNGRCTSGGKKQPQPEPKACALLPGMIRTANGDCVCPRGTVLGTNGCYKPQSQCTLLPGMIRTKNGQCICPKGTELKNEACRKIVQTPPTRQCSIPGQVKTKDGRCVCPRGTDLRNGACRKVVVQTCAVGTVGKFPNCRKVNRVPVIRINPTVINPGIKLNQPRNPTVKQPVVKQPVVRKPVVRQPVVKKPVVRKPVIRKPVIRTPVVKGKTPIK
jgi:hypothetical protein